MRTVTSGDFHELVYAYRYDGRRRLVEKKIPGRGWDWLVYNKNDQLVLTQDSVQRGKASKEWSYTKYDAFGRVTSTGIYTNAATNGFLKQQQMASYVDGHMGTLWEERNGAAAYPATIFPTGGSGIVIKPLLVNYYDDYSFTGAAGLPEQNVIKSGKLKTLLTGTLVYKDNGRDSLLTVNYYDDRARLIQSVGRNHLGGTDRVTNTYTFTGELVKSTRIHIAKGVTTNIITSNDYDHVGRLLATKHRIGSQDSVVLAKNEYNEIGQLKKKSMGGNGLGSNFHTAVDYAYNERGWTRSASSPHFTIGLDYQVDQNNVLLAGAQYNGNIARQRWGHGATTNSTFVYGYDGLDRLLSGTSSGAALMIETLTYDDMGNIRTLARNNGTTSATTTTTYAYNNSNKSNRLASLTGALSGSYTYDANGNVTKDRTNMTIRYNHLNLPDSVYNSGGTVKVGYLYDAQGAKLRKYSNQGGNRDYVAGIEYGATNIELIHTPEGVAFRNSNGSYTYRYNLSDHLGNVRATVYRNPLSDSIEALQRDDYYPFGKQRVVAAGVNKYLYNGKEKQEEFGGQYDYGARFYDAEIGRWNVLDPLAEKGYSISPYNYGFNNPILFIDPDGRWPDLGRLWSNVSNWFNNQVSGWGGGRTGGGGAGGSWFSRLFKKPAKEDDRIYPGIPLEPVVVTRTIVRTQTSQEVANEPKPDVEERVTTEDNSSDDNGVSFSLGSLSAGAGVGVLTGKLFNDFSWAQGGKTFNQYRKDYWATRNKPTLDPLINRQTGEMWRQYMELHHRYIPQRWKWAPNWLQNNRWNLKPLSSLEHAKIDPHRARRAPKWVKDLYNLKWK